MSKHFVWPLLIVFLLNVFLTVFPFVKLVKDSLPKSPTEREKLDYTILFVGTQVTLATLLFGFGVAQALAKTERGEVKFDQLLEEARKKLVPPYVQALHDHQFYDHFYGHCERAKTSVYVCYFELTPPGEPGKAEKEDYYRKHFDLIRRNPKVAFRRLVRNSRENCDWVRELVHGELEGLGNVELAVLKEPGSKDMPLALSVQVIDAEKAWLVAVETHGRLREPRDLYVEHPDVGRTMEKYYNRLWDRSLVVFTKGLVTEEGREYLKGAHREEKDG